MRDVCLCVAAIFEIISKIQGGVTMCDKERPVKGVLSWILTVAMACLLFSGQTMRIQAAGATDPLDQREAQQVLATQELSAAGTEEAAVIALRQKMKERESSITVSLILEDVQQSEGIAERLYKAAIVHTGEPTEGDYLRWHCGEWKASIKVTSANGVLSAEIVYTIAYYTTKEQEQELDHKVQNVLDALDLYEATEYEKIRGIYDYICTHITYDYENLDNWKYKLPYTAYAAMMHETAVCQGYASLFYRMALSLGVDVRLIGGEAGGAHAWNIVRIGDVYYNVDATYDAALTEGGKPYGYFLCSDESFSDRWRFSEYETTEFRQMHPMSQTDYVDAAAAEGNRCGENLVWNLSVWGVLTISGTGDMYDYTSQEQVPWYVSRKRVKTVVVEEGVTTIGSFAFAECDKLTVVKLPKSLAKVGSSAFVGCSSLWHILYAGTQDQWESIVVDTENEKLKAAIRHNACTDSEKLDIENQLCQICVANCTHQWNVETVLQPASCQMDGEAVYRCALCAATETRPLSASGHSWIEANCTESKTCQDCGSTEGEPLGHCYDSAIVAPTCMDEGYTSHTCGNCGHSYTDTPTAMREHTFGQWETVKEATAGEAGEKLRVCTACGEEERDLIPAVGQMPTATQPDAKKVLPEDNAAISIVVIAVLVVVAAASVIVLHRKKTK